MTITEMAKRRKLSDKKKRQLETICQSNPDIFMKNGEIDIPTAMESLYLPDLRVKGDFSHYAHIVNAIAQQQILLPNTIDIEQDALESYLDELISKGLAKCKRNIEVPNCTIDCILTIDCEKWINRKTEEKRKLIHQYLNDIAPNGLIKPISII